MKIFEGRYKGARMDAVHFEAKTPAEADGLFHGFCVAHGVRYVEVKEWLIDLKPFANLPADSVPVDIPTERPSISEQRAALRARTADVRIDS